MNRSEAALIAHRRRMGMIPSDQMPATRDDDCGCGGKKAKAPKQPEAPAQENPATVKGERIMIRCSECKRLVSTRAQAGLSAVQDFVCSQCRKA